MSDELSVPVSFDAFMAILVVVAITIAVRYWLHVKKRKRMREKFIKPYNSSDLRTSPYTIGSVYRVVNKNGGQLSVVSIWHSDGPVTDGKEYQVEASHLVPFDHDRFVSGY